MHTSNTRNQRARTTQQCTMAVLLALCLLGESGAAYGTLTTNLTHFYEADLFPTNSGAINIPPSSSGNFGWVTGTPTGSPIIGASGGILSSEGTAPGDNAGWFVGNLTSATGNSDWDHNDSIGSSVLFRTRVDSPPTPAFYGALNVQVRNGSRYWTVYFRPDNIYLANALTNPQIYTPTTAFRDYQIDVIDNTLTLWADNRTTLLFDHLGSANSFTGNAMWFGEVSNQYGKFELDYLRWTNAGLFVGVPEPGTVSLIGLGGLIAFLRRRTRRHN